ncbi:hypothetical protein VTO73DRAFT_6093 [Trametes versicolor]
MASPSLHEEEFDIILAGGGTAAGVIAGRLSSACPSLRILMLETGPHTQEDLAHVQPARFLSHLRPDTITAKHVVARPSEHLDGRSLIVQCGQCVGGGSSVNFTMYTRAPASDFDDWANVYNNPGWAFKDVLPLIKKIERYQNSPGVEHHTHGYDGPLKVSYGGYRNAVGEDYLATVAQYDTGRPIVNDINTMVEDVNRFERYPKWIDEQTGRRSDVPHHYVYNNASYGSNLQLRAACTVKRVIMENGRAVGVEYMHNPRINADADNVLHIAKAKRMVIVSAGTFGSPGILERSGIGAPGILKQNGVEPIVDLPGVGENYNDHPLLFLPFYAAEGTVTLDGIFRNDKEEIEKWSTQWVSEGKGLMATNGIDAGCKYRPTPAELEDIGPTFKERWESFYANSPEKSILWIGELAMYVGPSQPSPDVLCFCTGGFSMYPSGIGSVHITSGEDPHAPVDFVSGVFSSPDDLAVMRHMYKRCREIGRRMSCFRGLYAPDHPTFPDGSAAHGPEALTGMPVDVHAPDLVYTEEDDKAIDVILKSHILTAWHSNGTCTMKPRDQGGVVDPRLNVYGAQGLKVADVSICPANVSTNTYSTALTIGEKAAVLIAEELGITGV